MTIALIILALVFAFVSGFSKAICDLSEEGKLKFYKKTFWLKHFSWQNKWKYNVETNGEKFWGSSRWFVLFTDAWHLFQFFLTVALLMTGYFIGRLSVENSEYYTFGLLIAFGIRTAIFHLFHDSTNWIKKK